MKFLEEDFRKYPLYISVFILVILLLYMGEYEKRKKVIERDWREFCLMLSADDIEASALFSELRSDELYEYGRHFALGQKFGVNYTNYNIRLSVTLGKAEVRVESDSRGYECIPVVYYRGSWTIDGLPGRVTYE